MNKKIFSLAMSLILSIVMLSGCASNSEVLEKVTTDNLVTQNTVANDGGGAQSGVAETTAAKQETSDMIGKDEAIRIALERVPGATESDVRVHYDRDDRRDIYEGSIVYNETVYDFEIDARTGDIIEWESESIYD